jgi:hypothetical protein
MISVLETLISGEISRLEGRKTKQAPLLVSEEDSGDTS